MKHLQNTNSQTGQSLVLFTLEYPYGKAETFLESEIRFLSEQFAHVYAVPTSNKFAVGERITPENVIVVDDIAEVNRKFTLASFSPFLFEFLVVWGYSFWHSDKKWNYFRFIKSLMHHYYNDVSKRKAIAALIASRHLENALFYDYWFVNSSLSLLSLRRRGKIRAVVCRTHRFDLYDEATSEGVVPFREWIVRGMDRIFAISSHGKQYLLDRIHPGYHSKVSIQYLGVDTPKKIPVPNGKRLVVSCSTVLGVKQVDKIATALRSVNIPFRWIHIGDGPELAKVQKIAETFPDHIQVELRGFVPNQAVLSFYENNYVDCFISLSANEGLPVSMMEVQSFGIPIVAPAITGIPEIVNRDTGYLLDENYTVADVTGVIEKILNGELAFDRDRIRQNFLERFNASKNYRSFAETLASLYA